MDKLKYVAGFRDKRVEFEADSLWDAKQKAVAQLGITNKRHMGLVWVVLAEKNGKPVTQVITN